MADQSPKPSAPAQISIVDDEGNWGTISPEEAHVAVTQHGFRIPSPQEIEHHNAVKEQGGVGGAIGAGLEEAASLGTFGLSRELENATGFTTPQEQAARAEAHPIARMVGAAVPIAATLGAEAPEAAAGAAAESAPGVLGTVGEAARAIPGAEALSKPISAVTGTAEDVSNLIPELGEGPVAQIATKALRGATSGALAGGVFGAGNAISEDALGDPDALGEHLLQNVGIGALWGGVPGGILGPITEPLPESASEASEAIQKTQDTLNKVGPIGKALAGASSMVSGAPQSEIEYAIANKARSLVTPEEFLSQAGDLSESLKNQHSSITKLTKAAFNDLRPAETKAALEEMPSGPAKDAWLSHLVQIDSAIQEMRSEPSLYSQFHPAYLEKALNDSISKIGDASSAYDVFNALDELKGKMDDNLISYGREIPPEQRASEAIASKLRSSIKKTLENEDAFGEAGARQAEFNDAYSKYQNSIGKNSAFRSAFMKKIPTPSGKVIYQVDPSKVQSYLRSLGTLGGEAKEQALHGFMEASQNLLDQVQKTYDSLPNSNVDIGSAKDAITKNLGKVSETTEQGKFNKVMGRLGGGAHNAQLGEIFAGYEALRNPVLGAGVEAFNMARAPALAIRRYAQIARASSSVASAIKKGAASVFGGELPGIKEFSSIVPAVSGLVGTQGKNWSEAKAKSEAVRNIASNVSALSDRLSSSTAHFAKSAPKTSVGLMSAASRATAYLQSVLPPDSQKFMLSEPSEISKSSQDRLDRALNLIHQPQIAFKWIKDGTISSEDLRGLTQVYPSTYGAMRTELLSHLTEKSPKDLSYPTKIALSKFIGQPLDGSLDAQAISSNQNSLASAKGGNTQPQATMRKTSVAGMKYFKRSQRAETQTQDSEAET